MSISIYIRIFIMSCWNKNNALIIEINIFCMYNLDNFTAKPWKK